MSENSLNDRLEGNLTNKERQVVDLVLKGYSNTEVAAHLGSSKHTIKTHVSNIFQKLSVSNRTELATFFAASRPKRKEPDLSGIWLSVFSYTASILGSSEYYEDDQFDLEILQNATSNLFDLEGTNDHPVNEQIPYKHKLFFRFSGQTAYGIWENINTSHVGCFQLLVHQNQFAMFGKHMGTSSDSNVQIGTWKWIKLANLDALDKIANGQRLRPAEELRSLLKDSVKGSDDLSLDDVIR